LIGIDANRQQTAQVASHRCALVLTLFGMVGPKKGRTRMPLINVVVTLIVVGVLLWLVNTYIPMDGKIKNILNIVVVIAVVIWLLQAFGLLGELSSIRIGR
jgi:hypothetical protein